MKKLLIFILLFSFFFSTAIVAQASVAETKTFKDVYNVFTKALGGKKSLLNANNKSGEQGVMGYIGYYKNDNSISTTTINIATISTTNTNKILDTTTGPREKLDWFKTKLLLNSSGAVALNDKDKDGIKQAMVARYKEFCYAAFKKTATKELLSIYNEKVKVLESAKKLCINDCVNNPDPAKGYEACSKDASAAGKTETELCKITKDTCVNNCYTTYQTNLKIKYDEVFTGTATTPGIRSTLVSCLGESRITNWWAK